MRAFSISTLWTIPVLLLAFPIYFFTQHNSPSSSTDSPAKFGCDLLDFDSLFNYEGVSRDHYSVTSHHLVTADKYHLLMIRVGLTESQRLALPKKQQKNFNKKVLVLHEFGGSADSAFYNGDRSYGFFLVNQGYDVWMGNNRGNKYSNAHYGENSKIDNFYDYSFGEMGMYDVPAMYQEILSYYPMHKITVIGYSQGTSEMFAGLVDEVSSEFLTEHTEKFIAVAPIVYLNNLDSWFFGGLAKLIMGSSLWRVTDSFLGFKHSLPMTCRSKHAFGKIAAWYCNLPLANHVCENFIPRIPIDPQHNDIFQNLERVLEYYPSGASIKSLAHLAQMILIPSDQHIFQKFDYGPKENLQRYGTEEVGTWDVSRTKAKITLIVNENDNMSNKKDVGALIEALPEGSVKLRTIAAWSHITNLFARDPSPFFEILASELEEE